MNARGILVRPAMKIPERDRKHPGQDRGHPDIAEQEEMPLLGICQPLDVCQLRKLEDAGEDYRNFFQSA